MFVKEKILAMKKEREEGGVFLLKMVRIEGKRLTFTELFCRTFKLCRAIRFLGRFFPLALPLKSQSQLAVGWSIGFGGPNGGAELPDRGVKVASGEEALAGVGRELGCLEAGRGGADGGRGFGLFGCSGGIALES